MMPWFVINKENRKMFKVAASLACLASWASAQDLIETIALDQGFNYWVLDNFGRKLAPGAQVRFSVEGNPTTGYTWHHEEGASNGAFSVTSDFVSSDSELVGAPGTYYYTVTAGDVEGINGDFHIWYGRDSDGGIENAEKEYKFNIYVEA